MSSLIDELWEDAVGGAEWLKQVVFGEFDDHRSTSAVVADMLISFVPAFIIVTSARDLTAVFIRLARHPEKRQDLTEWGLVIACAVPLVLPILAAAAGSVGTLAGTVVGGIAGSEAGAAVKATCLMLLKEGGKMLEPLVKFLRRFIKGDILAVLRDLKFIHYSEAIVRYTHTFLGKLLAIVHGVISKAKSVAWIARVGHLIERLEQVERDFYALQNVAAVQIPKALALLDSRLAKALEEHMAALPHPVHTTLPAPKPKPVPPQPVRVQSMEHNPLGHPTGLEPAGSLHPTTPERPNLHPQMTSGQWEAVNEAMSERAAAYQKQITGKTGEAYVVNGVKFDGVGQGGLIEAKGPGYAQFVKDGEFKPFFQGQNGLLDQANRQIAAANGTPITWHVAEGDAATAIQNLFSENGVTGITVVHTPPQ